MDAPALLPVGGGRRVEGGELELGAGEVEDEQGLDPGRLGLRHGELDRGACRPRKATVHLQLHPEPADGVRPVVRVGRAPVVAAELGNRRVVRRLVREQDVVEVRAESGGRVGDEGGERGAHALQTEDADACEWTRKREGKERNEGRRRK